MTVIGFSVNALHWQDSRNSKTCEAPKRVSPAEDLFQGADLFRFFEEKPDGFLEVSARLFSAAAARGNVQLRGVRHEGAALFEDARCGLNLHAGESLMLERERDIFAARNRHFALADGSEFRLCRLIGRKWSGGGLPFLTRFFPVGGDLSIDFAHAHFVRSIAPGRFPHPLQRFRSGGPELFQEPFAALFRSSPRRGSPDLPGLSFGLVRHARCLWINSRKDRR